MYYEENYFLCHGFIVGLTISANAVEIKISYGTGYEFTNEDFYDVDEIIELAKFIDRM